MVDKKKLNHHEIVKLLSRNKLDCYENKDYPIEKITDQDFEKLTYFLFKESNQLKKIYNYDKPEYIIGGSDKGRDVTLKTRGETTSIIQCKHSINKTPYSKQSLLSEVLKTILYIYMYPNLVWNKEFQYIIVVSEILKEDATLLLDNFYQEVMENETKLIQEIQKLRKNFQKIKKSIPEQLPNLILKQLKDIGLRMQISKIENHDIQSYLKELSPSTLDLFFKIKIVIAIEQMAFPFINKKYDEIKSSEIDKYKQKRFYNELEKIDAKDKTKEMAILNFYKKLEAQIILQTTHPLDFQESLVEYENNIIEYQDEKKELYLLNFSLTGKDFFSLKPNLIKVHSNKYYLEFMSEIQNQKIRRFNETPNFFAKGTVHDLVNIQKIKTWEFIKGEE